MPRFYSPSRTLSLTLASTMPKGLPEQGRSDFMSGRQALFALAQHLAPSGGKVLMPAWIAEGVYLPFQLAQWEIEFYDLDHQANPKWEQLALQIQSRPFDLVVLVHYFGQVRGINRMIGLAGEHTTILEDWAHAYPDQNWPAPQKGHWALFSPTKLIGTTDGAWLIGTTTLSAQRKEAVKWQKWSYLLWQLLYLMASTMLSEGIPVRSFWKKLSGGSYARAYRQLIALTKHPLATSRLGKWLIKHTDHREVVKRRKIQAQYYERHLDNPHLQVLLHTEEEHTLLGFPIWVEDRDAFADYLSEYGIRGQYFTEKWWFSERTTAYEGAWQLMNHHYLLPIHQDYSPADIAHIVAIVNAYRS